MPTAAPATAPASLRQTLAETLTGGDWLPTFLVLVRRFREDRLALTAGSLTFTTVISVVPLATVMLALFSAFPMFAALQESLQKYLQQTLLPDAVARPILALVTQFSSRASRLGIVGLIALVFSALAMMLTIDRALNSIWRVRKRRPIAQRVLIYWAALTLGPLLFGVSLAATSFALSASNGILGNMPRGSGALVSLVEFVVESVGIASLFHYVPNVYVRWRHAMAGGIFVATGLYVLKHALTFYLSSVPTYSVVYGAFAALPIFLVWIFISWIIVLLGAVIAAYAPMLGTQMSRLAEVPGTDFRVALLLMAVLARAKASGQRGLGAEELALTMGTDPLQIDPVLDGLIELDWVGRLDEEGARRYVLLCDPAKTPAEPLISRFLIEPAPDLGGLWRRAGFGAMTVAQILDADPVPAIEP
ncbi:MAG: YihY family inner membrane protein [Pseudomonadota bacterium]|nr:YihY family inner membrane protein [Pseudomonadota bacterium]